MRNTTTVVVDNFFVGIVQRNGPFVPHFEEGSKNEIESISLSSRRFTNRMESFIVD